MLERYAVQFFLLAIFFMMAYSVVEVIKKFVLSLPDSFGRWCHEGLPAELKRWVSFIVAYCMAWLFDFRFASMIFDTVNEGALPNHANYFIVACLLFCGSRWIHEQIETHYNVLRGKERGIL